jgi:hypothetical protein
VVALGVVVVDELGDAGLQVARQVVVFQFDLPPLERLQQVRETYTGIKEYDNGKKALF